jgi:hypothetical protein
MSKKYLVEINVLNRLLSFFSKAKTDKSYQTALDKAFKSNNPEFNRLYTNWVKSGDKLIDGIINEPLGGAHNDIPAAHQLVKEAILKNLIELDKLDPEKRIEERIEKFCKMGVVIEG